MLKLTYTCQIRTKVETGATFQEILENVAKSDYVTIVTTSCAIVTHIGNVTTFYSGMTEQEYESLFTAIVAPYSTVGEREDLDLCVNAVQIVMLNYSKRLQEYKVKNTKLKQYIG